MSFRQRSLSGLADSPVNRDITDAEIESIISSESKGDNATHCGYGTDAPLSLVNVTCRILKLRIRDVRRRLFSGKRPAEDDLSEYLPSTKRLREVEQDLTKLSTIELCEPIRYEPMHHEDHADDLRHFRVKSKSCTEGSTQRSDRRQRKRFNRHLSF